MAATKTAPAAETETPVSTPLVEILKRPDSITLFGYAHEVMEEMITHARNGYHLFPGVTPQYYEISGTMSVLLALGDPLPLFHQRAAEHMAEAQRKEAVEFDRRVAAEAKRLTAEKAQADLEAQVAAAQAVADAQVARIRADADAAIARIQANL